MGAHQFQSSSFQDNKPTFEIRIPRTKKPKIDLLRFGNVSQKHLKNMNGKMIVPFDLNFNDGSCINNIFIKNNSIETNPFKYCNLYNVRHNYNLYII